MSTEDNPFGTQPIHLKKLDETSVHNIRKATKQLRARLQLQHQLEGHHHKTEKLRAAVKELARLLRAQRDADVLAGLLQELITASDDLTVQQLLSALRSDLYSGPMPAENMKRVHTLVREIQKKTPKLIQDRYTEAEINQVMVKKFTTLCESGRDLLTGEDWEALHNWRKQVKKLLYQYQLKTSMTPKDLYILDHLEELGTGLGNINDLCMLERFVTTHQSQTTRAHTLAIYSKVHEMIAARRLGELQRCQAVFREISNLQISF